MRPSKALKLHRTRIREIALSHRVSDVRVFGSAVRGDNEPGGDLDFLVEPTAQTTFAPNRFAFHRSDAKHGITGKTLPPSP